MGGVVRRYIDILTMIIHFPYSTCNSSFFGSSRIICSLALFLYILCMIRERHVILKVALHFRLAV